MTEKVIYFLQSFGKKIMNKNFKKICTLKGGISTEREISLLSGQAMAEAARSLGYDVDEFDFTGDVFALISHLKEINPDCVINGLHGKGGEDGNIQALLNFMKIPYTHSDVLASSVGMDKRISESIFKHKGILVPKARLFAWKDFQKSPDFPLPFVVKPVDGGSSCGVYIINKPSDLEGINWTFGDNVYVSEYIPGLELSVGVLNGQALEVTNIVVKSGFYDYTNKYTDGTAIHELPANLPEKIRAEAMAAAEQTHAILGCRGTTRTDFRYNDVTEELFVLEINTQPGMTRLSLVPEQAKYVGISFEQLIETLIQDARYDEV